MNTPDIQIRPFVAEDQSAARGLILAGLGEHFGRVDETRNPDVDDIRTRIVEPGGVFLVAERSGEIVGTGGLVKEADGVGRIVRMSVARSHRRQGVARATVAALLDAARQSEYREVVVETNHDWADAVGLYTSCGFGEYDRDEVSVHLSRPVAWSDPQGMAMTEAPSSVAIGFAADHATRRTPKRAPLRPEQIPVSQQSKKGE